MANPVSTMYWNERLQSAEPMALELMFKITAAKTVSNILGAPVLTAFDAIASQSVIDSFLGTTNEFLLAAFDATSMGTDAFAAIIDMKGQCKEVEAFKVEAYSAGAQLVAPKAAAASSALTASTLETAVAKGSSGNVALKLVLTGLDAVTDGLIKVTIYWKPK